METFINWLKTGNLSEADTRYSVEMNFRTKIDEVLKNAAKITLGYASAGLKRSDYHVKQVFEEQPLRILVSSRNWDDGEWVGVVSWNPEHKSYVVSRGFYNKDRKSVSIQQSKSCDADNAADIVREVKNLMYGLQDEPDRHIEKLKKVPHKRGPKS